ncbi:hypothetical protein [Mesobacterium pallidum]|uniref:hypothetical protein n=1 Tax=Mesobacterium pallidum TaxID=2872037 RepID=UPI001EE277AC|nr:hypothetical protein [Mesobacterium pallidum]
MRALRGFIEDAFVLKGKGVAVMLTHVEGMPEVAMRVMVGDHVLTILALGQNSTDGQAVSHRPCLTGKPGPGYGGVVVDWPGNPRDIARQWVEDCSELRSSSTGPVSAIACPASGPLRLQVLKQNESGM